MGLRSHFHFTSYDLVQMLKQWKWWKIEIFLIMNDFLPYKKQLLLKWYFSITKNMGLRSHFHFTSYGCENGENDGNLKFFWCQVEFYLKRSNFYKNDIFPSPKIWASEVTLTSPRTTSYGHENSENDGKLKFFWYQMIFYLKRSNFY